MAILALATLGIGAGDGGASCDVIPGVTVEFRGALGSLNRPFAIPGDVGQQMQIRFTTCDPSLVFDDLVGGVDREDDYFVSVFFEAPDGTVNAVVLHTATNAGACAGKVAGLAGGGSATCEPAAAGTQEFTVTDDVLTFRFPDTDLLFLGNDDRTFTGPATIAVTPVTSDLPLELDSSRCAATTAVDLVACIDELFEQNGDCTTTADDLDPIFPHFTALPPANDYEALCITESNECDSMATEFRFTIDAAGNALLPIDYRGILLRPDGLPVPRLVLGDTEFEAFDTTPGAGNDPPVAIPGESFLDSYSPGGRKLPPVFEPLADPDEPTTLSLFGSADSPVSVVRVARRAADLTSGSPVYGECSGGTNDGAPCVLAAECPGGSCGATTCYLNQVDQLTACTDDGDCGVGEECGPALFDFSDRLMQDGGANAVGPIAIPPADYDLLARNPVPIEGLIESADLFAFVELEPIAAYDGVSGGRVGADLNGDTDETDPVLVLRDRETGVIQAIGDGGSDGRAVTRIRRPPFSFSAVAAEGDLVAFLEPEPLQGNCAATPLGCDADGNRDVFDTLLRVYQLGTPGELTASQIAADPAPVIDGRSLAVSGGLVFFRRNEAAGADRINRIMSVDSDELVAGDNAFASFMTPDGRHVGFSTDAGLTGGSSFSSTAFVHDRDPNEDGTFDPPGDIATIATPPRSPIALTGVFSASASADGRYVAVTSEANDLVGGDANMANDVFIRDRDPNGDGLDGADAATVRVSVTDDEMQATGASAAVGLSRVDLSVDGRFVAFDSDATNLPAGADTNLETDVFVRDRDPNGDGFDGADATTVRVSVLSNGNEAVNGPSYGPAISADGGSVAFLSQADDLTTATIVTPALFVHDLASGITQHIGISTAGEPADGPVTRPPDISADGRFVVFQSQATNLVPGDTNGISDTFLHDRDADEDGIFDEVGGVSTTLASIGSDGAPARDSINQDFDPWISPDGRFAAFSSGAADMAPQVSTPGLRQVYLHDRLTGLTKLVSAKPTGEPASTSNTDTADVSREGAFVLLASADDGLREGTGTGPGPGGNEQAWVHGPDPNFVPNIANITVSPDGDLQDTLLQAFDPSGPTFITLGAATQASIDAGDAAFLLPESATGVDLNADSDLDDAYVYLSLGGGAAQKPDGVNQEAIAVGLSADLVVALEPTGTAGEGFVRVYDRGAMSWSGPHGAATKAFALEGDVVAFAAASDGELHVYDASVPALTALGEPALDFVVDGRAVAFRSEEADLVQDLNGDGDQVDAAMRVYDVDTATTYETEQAATPCRLEACDPRFPYRIAAGTVTFLTLEADHEEEGAGNGVAPGCADTGTPGECDLDGDGVAGGVVLQTFKIDAAVAEAQTMAGESVDTLAGVEAGVCTDTGEPCVVDADCAAGSCIVPPGSCVEATLTACTLDNPAGCGADQFCAPLAAMPSQLRCYDKLAIPPTCQRDNECGGAAVCFDGVSDTVRLVGPLRARSAGEQAFVRAAVVLDSPAGGGTLCDEDADCAGMEICNEAGVCQVPTLQLVAAGGPDSEGDGVADDFDNCPFVPNSDQVDTDTDGAGDPCDITPLPEPGGTLLLAIGVAGLAILGRRRARP